MIELMENKAIYKTKEGKIIGEVEVVSEEKNKKNIIHTYVDPEYRGQKIASKLLTAITDYYQKQGIELIYTCSYAKSWKEKISNNK